MTNRFTARKAEARDVEAMVCIQRVAVEKAWKNAIKEDFDAFLREKFDHDAQVKKYAERINDPSRILYVVEDAHKIAGFGGVRVHGPEDQPPGYEYQGNAFYLDPAYEGSGASMVLIEGLLEELKKRNAKNIVGWCLADNRAARNFYEKRGGKLITNAVAPPEYNIAPHVAYGWTLE